MTVAQILELAAKIEKDELKIDDVVDGLMDFNEQLEAIDDEDALEESMKTKPTAAPSPRKTSSG